MRDHTIGYTTPVIWIMFDKVQAKREQPPQECVVIIVRKRKKNPGQTKTSIADLLQ